MGRPSLINRDQIARAALSAIDDGGIAGFSLERLASNLGVKAPSLYHHFRDKDEVLHEALRVMFIDVRFPPQPNEGEAGRWLLELAVELRESVLKHPNAAPLIATQSPRSVLVAEYDRSSRILASIGIPLKLHMLLFETLEALVVGSALYECGRRAAGTADLFDLDESKQYLTLYQSMKSNPFTPDELFVESVKGFLRGVLPPAALEAPMDAKQARRARKLSR